MRKWLLLTPLLIASLCSCGRVTVNGRSQWAVVGGSKMSELTADFSAEKIQNITEQLIEYDTNQWEQLTDMVSTLGADGAGYADYGAYDYIRNQGVFSENGTIYFSMGNEGLSWEALEPLKAVLGSELDAFIEKAKGLEEGDTAEMILNGYGLVALRYPKDYYRTDTLFGIVSSGLRFKDEAMQQKIEALCGNDLFMSTVSCNDTKQYVELSYPSYEVNSRYDYMVPSAYYQITMDRAGEVKQMKLIISTPNYSNVRKIELSEDKYNRLNTILEKITGETLDTSLLNADIKQNLLNGKHLSGSVGPFNYTISKEESYTSYDGIDLTVVTFTK